jgi:cytoskeletal protein CcmA (bactofilin family)
MGFDQVELETVAVITEGMLIQGQVRSREHVRVNGEIDGSLHLDGYDLTVAAQARVRADVTAREVDIAGTFEGNLDASKRLTIRDGGRLFGDVRTPGIVIEDGASVQGRVEIVNSQISQESVVVPASSAKAAATG